MPHSVARPLAGFITIAVTVGIVAFAATMFRGGFSKATVPVTVLSTRAGLVMNPDARVQMRGVQVGNVASIEE
ncbi:MlaD family protein, partial [Mycobacterium sp.]|uniref:MlaD family protein n=1 Tax=Mycobacterium sp. TaxID=1785 RepID=UPI003C74BC41